MGWAWDLVRTSRKDQRFIAAVPCGTTRAIAFKVSGTEALSRRPFLPMSVYALSPWKGPYGFRWEARDRRSWRLARHRMVVNVGRLQCSSSRGPEDHGGVRHVEDWFNETLLCLCWTVQCRYARWRTVSKKSQTGFQAILPVIFFPATLSLRTLRSTWELKLR